jgi:hypothetical protein
VLAADALADGLTSEGALCVVEGTVAVGVELGLELLTALLHLLPSVP